MSFGVNIKFPSGEHEMRYIGDPITGRDNWDFGTLRTNPGPHMICDLNGRGLKWAEVENGMVVKIKAKNVNPKYPTFEFLYSSEGSAGKYFISSTDVIYARILLYLSNERIFILNHQFPI